MKHLDLVNKRFGRLVVVKKSHRKNNKVMWECLCDCGNTTFVQTCNLNAGRVKSCGCLHKDQLIERNITHNQTHTKLYDVWIAMRKRCNNPKDSSYHRYGGRGIKVCDEWQSSFEDFCEWSMSNGYSENLSIDRIDVNGNYCPENCRWADKLTQANNTRTNRYITYNGETHSIADWARILGMSYCMLSSRLNAYNWSVEKAFTTPNLHLFYKSH